MYRNLLYMMEINKAERKGQRSSRSLVPSLERLLGLRCFPLGKTKGGQGFPAQSEGLEAKACCQDPSTTKTGSLPGVPDQSRSGASLQRHRVGCG